MRMWGYVYSNNLGATFRPVNHKNIDYKYLRDVCFCIWKVKIVSYCSVLYLLGKIFLWLFSAWHLFFKAAACSASKDWNRISSSKNSEEKNLLFVRQPKSSNLRQARSNYWRNAQITKEEVHWIRLRHWFSRFNECYWIPYSNETKRQPHSENINVK